MSSRTVMVDVEADGPIPGDYSMILLGAVIVEPGLSRTYFGRLRPISERWQQRCLGIFHVTREESLTFPDPADTMCEFREWLMANIRKTPLFVSDNNGFDWQFVNWYFHHFLGANPFGHSSANLGSLYKGLAKNMKGRFRWLRNTKHSHNPVADAIGNAEALLAMRGMGLRNEF